MRLYQSVLIVLFKHTVLTFIADTFCEDRMLKLTVIVTLSPARINGRIKPKMLK
jgi:hypothetical protein